MRATRIALALVAAVAVARSARADVPQPDLASVVARYRQLGDDFFAASQFVEAAEAYEKAERRLSEAGQDVPGSLYGAIGGSLAKAGAAAFTAAQDYETAARYFKRAEEAYQAGGLDVPSPLYRALARAYDQMGQIAPAYGAYARFLGRARVELEEAEAHGGNPDLEKAMRDAEDARTRLKQRLDETALQFQVQPDGTEIKVDRGFIGTSPIEPYPVSPGPHQITFWAPGYEPMSVDADVKAGAVVPVVVSLKEVGPAQASSVVPKTPIPATAPKEEVADTEAVDADIERLGAGGRGPNWWLVGGLGALAVGAAAGALVLRTDAVGLEDEALGLEETPVATPAEQREAAARTRSKRDDAAGLRTWALGVGVTGMAAAGVAVWLALSSGGAETAVRTWPTVTPTLAPEGWGIVLRWGR